MVNIIRTGNDEGNTGGPADIRADFSAVVASYGAGVFYPVTDNRGGRLVKNDGSFIASGNPLTNVVATRDGLKRYTVQKKDTLARVATQFGIDAGTLKGANPGARSGLRAGQQLTILPVSGILYTITESDSLESLVVRFGVNPDLVKRYNPDFQRILGSANGTLILPFVKPDKAFLSQKITELPDLKGYFTLPARGWNLGELHEKNAVDIANKCGSEVYAAAEGVVVPDEKLGDGTEGWNDGYGTFVLLEHPNGTRTRYAHLGRALVKAGEELNTGAIIGIMGNTGNTHGPTGCHLHFEVLDAKNPFAIR